MVKSYIISTKTGVILAFIMGEMAAAHTNDGTMTFEPSGKDFNFNIEYIAERPDPSNINFLG